MNKFKFVRGLFLALMLTFSASLVYAQGPPYFYNMTVPKLGGVNRTSNEIKQIDDANYYVHGVHGSGYTLRVRLEKVDNSSLSNWMDFASGAFLDLPNDGQANQTVHVALKTKYNTYVDVQSIGEWDPD